MQEQQNRSIMKKRMSLGDINDKTVTFVLRMGRISTQPAALAKRFAGN